MKKRYMKKRYLSILVIALILVVIIVYYLTSPASFIPSDNLTESQVQENRTPFRFPFIFPWQTEETPSTAGEGAGAGEGGGAGEGSELPSNYTQKVNYTLNIESSASPLEVLTNYSVNNVILNIVDITPYSVEIESDTTACVLLTEIGPSGTIRWEVDGKDCEPSICVGFLGCSILMDKPHRAVIYYTPPSE